MDLYRTLVFLINNCKPGENCIYGKYYVSYGGGKRRARILRETLNEDVLVLYLHGVKLYGSLTVLSFKVFENTVSSQNEKYMNIREIPVEINNCKTTVCCDGKSIEKGRYSKYIYTKFALVHVVEDNAILGNLLLVGRRKIYPWWFTWRRFLRKLLP